MLILSVLLEDSKCVKYDTFCSRDPLIIMCVLCREKVKQFWITWIEHFSFITVFACIASMS